VGRVEVTGRVDRARFQPAVIELDPAAVEPLHERRDPRRRIPAHPAEHPHLAVAVRAEVPGEKAGTGRANVVAQEENQVSIGRAHSGVPCRGRAGAGLAQPSHW